MMMKNTYEFYGYIFRIDGTVLNPKGIEMNKIKDKYGGNYIYINVASADKRKYTKKIYIAKTLYCLVNDIKKIPYGYVIGFKDGNKDNCAYDNLELITIKENNEPYNYSRNQPRRVLNVAQVEEIRSKYKNQDGHFKSQYGKDSPSIRDLAKEYGVSAYTIQKVLNNTYFS